MTQTRAVGLMDLAERDGTLTGQPLCPGCMAGRLHPYRVDILLPQGWGGADSLSGWVAVCVGNRDYMEAVRVLRDDGTDAGVVLPACGFSLPMTPHSLPMTPHLNGQDGR